jgi:hypothetical protein
MKCGSEPKKGINEAAGKIIGILDKMKKKIKIKEKKHIKYLDKKKSII